MIFDPNFEFCPPNKKIWQLVNFKLPDFGSEVRFNSPGLTVQGPIEYDFPWREYEKVCRNVQESKKKVIEGQGSLGLTNNLGEAPNGANGDGR